LDQMHLDAFLHNSIFLFGKFIMYEYMHYKNEQN
jgi:hypothetical protein